MTYKLTDGTVNGQMNSHSFTNKLKSRNSISSNPVYDHLPRTQFKENSVTICLNIRATPTKISLGFINNKTHQI